MICQKCGSNNAENVVQCIHCGEVLFKPPVLDTNQNSRPSAPAGIKNIPLIRGLDGDPIFQLIKDEVVVRQYHCCVSYGLFRQVNGNGYTIVTNKRIVYYSNVKKMTQWSENIDEMLVDQSAGLTVFFKKGVSVVQLIIGVILLLLGIKMSFMTMLLFWLIGGLLIYLSFKSNYYLMIYAHCPTTGPIAIGSKGRAEAGMGVLGFIFGRGLELFGSGRPTSEIIKMRKELGTMLYELRTEKEAVIAKWQNQP